jgi:hypothetical protein
MTVRSPLPPRLPPRIQGLEKSTEAQVDPSRLAPQANKGRGPALGSWLHVTRMALRSLLAPHFPLGSWVSKKIARALLAMNALNQSARHNNPKRRSNFPCLFRTQAISPPLRWYTPHPCANLQMRLIPRLGTLSGRSEAWLSRLVRDQEVGGSNPLAPTTFPIKTAVLGLEGRTSSLGFTSVLPFAVNQTIPRLF